MSMHKTVYSFEYRTYAALYIVVDLRFQIFLGPLCDFKK